MTHAAKDFDLFNAQGDDVAKLDLALSYLDKSQSARAILDSALEHNISIRFNHENDDSVSYEVHTVNWDPSSAIKVSGGVQSAAIGLIHELYHSVDANYEQNIQIKDEQYDNLAEKYAVEAENQVATELGDVTRSDHHGAMISEQNPTEHTVLNSDGTYSWTEQTSDGSMITFGSYDPNGSTDVAPSPSGGTTPGSGDASSGGTTPSSGDTSSGGTTPSSGDTSSGGTNPAGPGDTTSGGSGGSSTPAAGGDNSSGGSSTPAAGGDDSSGGSSTPAAGGDSSSGSTTPGSGDSSSGGTSPGSGDSSSGGTSPGSGDSSGGGDSGGSDGGGGGRVGPDKTTGLQEETHSHRSSIQDQKLSGSAQGAYQNINPHSMQLVSAISSFSSVNSVSITDKVIDIQPQYIPISDATHEHQHHSLVRA